MVLAVQALEELPGRLPGEGGGAQGGVLRPLGLVHRDIAVGEVLHIRAGRDAQAQRRLIGQAGGDDLVDRVHLLLVALGHMVIAHSTQPVHAHEGRIGVGGVVVRALGEDEVGLAVDVRVAQLVVLHHLAVVGRRDGGKRLQVDGLHGAVGRPLRNLRIVILHHDGRGLLARDEQGVLGHDVAARDGDILDGDVVLVAEFLLDVLGPVVVVDGGIADLGAVVHRHGDGDVLLKRLPFRHFGVGGGDHGQHHHQRQQQGEHLLHRNKSSF